MSGPVLTIAVDFEDPHAPVKVQIEDAGEVVALLHLANEEALRFSHALFTAAQAHPAAPAPTIPLRERN